MIKAGFARVDVTPPLGSTLSGYFIPRYADGVLDPIQLNAVAFGDGESTAIIIASDFTGVTMTEATELREKIEKETGIPKDLIIISALHQHTSIRIGYKLGKKDSTGTDDPAYLSVLYRKYVDVAKMAIDDMSDAVATVGVEHAVHDIGFVRRYWLEDGTIATNPPASGPKPVRRCTESDNNVRLLRFKRSGKNCDKKDIAFVNFSTHADVIHGNKISADWPGFARRFVEADRDALCICTIGFEGDSNHCDFLTPSEKRYPNGVGYKHSEFMGRVIADTVNKMWDSVTELADGKVSGAADIIFTKSRTDGEELYEEKKAFKDNFDSGNYDKDNPPHITELATASRIVAIRTSPIYRQIPVTVLGLGDIAFVGLGGEPFTYYTEKMNELAKDKSVFCIACANGYEGYFTHAKAFDEGGYEASSTPFTKALEEQILDTTKKMLTKL